MKIPFLELGRQPLANGFLTEEGFDDEFFFDLGVTFDTETSLVSLRDFVAPERMFNEEYAYSSSCSNTMQEHFKQMAQRVHTRKVLEIGSNDGVFIKHLDPSKTVAVEPCSNFAELTRQQGYTTYDQFWTLDLAQKIRLKHGTFNFVYAANCMCHIQDIQTAFRAIMEVLDDNGTFVFEDPYLLNVIKNDAYDQFYDEHAHVFSIIALDNLLQSAGLYINDVDIIPTHGGSIRIWANKYERPKQTIDHYRDIEYGYQLDKLKTYTMFASRVITGRHKLTEYINMMKDEGVDVIGYGATSKSTVVYNYCNLGPDSINYITDTTPAKQGKFSPGTHIPIISPPDKIEASCAFLGAWNYKDEILAKEKDREFYFLTHIPKVMIL